MTQWLHKFSQSLEIWISENFIVNQLCLIISCWVSVLWDFSIWWWSFVREWRKVLLWCNMLDVVHVCQNHWCMCCTLPWLLNNNGSVVILHKIINYLYKLSQGSKLRFLNTNFLLILINPIRVLFMRFLTWIL